MRFELVRLLLRYSGATEVRVDSRNGYSSFVLFAALISPLEGCLATPLPFGDESWAPFWALTDQFDVITSANSNKLDVRPSLQ